MNDHARLWRELFPDVRKRADPRRESGERFGSGTTVGPRNMDRVRKDHNFGGYPLAVSPSALEGGFGTLRLALSSWCADYFASNDLDLYDFVPPPELAMDQRCCFAPLEEGAALRVVPGIDVIRHVVVEDEPGAREHAADDQVPPRLARVCDSAQQFLGLRRSQIRRVLRCLAALRFSCRSHAP